MCIFFKAYKGSLQSYIALILSSVQLLHKYFLRYTAKNQIIVQKYLILRVCVCARVHSSCNRWIYRNLLTTKQAQRRRPQCTEQLNERVISSSDDFWCVVFLPRFTVPGSSPSLGLNKDQCWEHILLWQRLSACSSKWKKVSVNLIKRDFQFLDMKEQHESCPSSWIKKRLGCTTAKTRSRVHCHPGRLRNAW